MKYTFLSLPETYYVSFQRTEAKALQKQESIALVTTVFKLISPLLRPVLMDMKVIFTHKDFPYNDTRTLPMFPDWQLLERENVQTLTGIYDSTLQTHVFFARALEESIIASWLTKAFSQSAGDRVISFSKIHVQAASVRIFPQDVFINNENSLNELSFSLNLGKKENEYWTINVPETPELSPITFEILHDAELFTLNFQIHVSNFTNAQTQANQELKKIFAKLVANNWKPELKDELFNLE